MNEALRSKLAQAAKKLGIRMPQVQLLLAQERFLFRIATVDKKKKLIWKGGSLILRRYSDLKPPRFTVDIDLLVQDLKFTDSELLIYQAMNLDLHDGFNFIDIKKYPMERDTPYGGERFEISWTFHGKANSEALRLDLCAGDDVDGETVLLNEVYLLDDKASTVTMVVYPAEFIFAEKLETLARFATGNSRLKDFIDLWAFSQTQDSKFFLEKCKNAIRGCFIRRSTPLKPNIWEAVLYNDEFQVLMEEARKRNFSTLNLPPVAVMFNELAKFLDMMKPWK